MPSDASAVAPTRADHSRLASRRPIDRIGIGDQVAEHLRRMIFSGELRTGDRIPIDAIGADLGVSRLPVREAILVMARDGLVRVRPHHGAYVAPFDEEAIRDLFEMVGMIQGAAAVRLVSRGEVAAIDRLRAIAAQVKRTPASAEVYELALEASRIINTAGASARQRSVLQALSRMFPTGVFAELAGSADATRRALPRLIGHITAGDAERIRRACAQFQQSHCEVIVAHLRTTGVIDLSADATHLRKPRPRRASA